MWTKYINTWRKRKKSGRRRHILHTHTANLYSFLSRGAERGRVRARKRESKRHRVGSNGIARAQPSGAIKFTCTHIFGGSRGSSSSSSDMCVYMVYVLCVRPHSDLWLSCYRTKQWGAHTHTVRTTCYTHKAYIHLLFIHCTACTEAQHSTVHWSKQLKPRKKPYHVCVRVRYIIVSPPPYMWCVDVTRVVSLAIHLYGVSYGRYMPRLFQLRFNWIRFRFVYAIKRRGREKKRMWADDRDDDDDDEKHTTHWMCCVQYMSWF